MLSEPAPQGRDDSLTSKLEDVTFRPVFILGDHRSGTTLFYQMLAATGAFNYVDFYHITHYDEIVYNHLQGREEVVRRKVAQKIEASGVNDRIFDRIPVTPSLPEEYGYILKRRPSFWYLPRTGQRTLPNLRLLGRKVQFVSPSERPLLLKNPWDFPNFLFLRQAFPAARFLFIHRHPIAVHNSKLKAMRSALSERNPYMAWLARGYDRLFRRPLQLLAARFIFFTRLGIRLLVRYATSATGYFLHNVPRLPSQDYLSLRYEDLCNAPGQSMDRVLDFLELQAENSPDYQAWIEPRPLQLLPDVAREEERIRRKLRPYLDRFDYGARP
jgi:hypothetical protein